MQGMNKWSKDTWYKLWGEHVCMNWVKMCNESYKGPAFFASLRACRSLLISLSMVPSLPLLSGAAHTTARRRKRAPIGCIRPAFELLLAWCLPDCIHIVAEPQETSLDGMAVGRLQHGVSFLMIHCWAEQQWYMAEEVSHTKELRGAAEVVDPALKSERTVWWLLNGWTLN